MITMSENYNDKDIEKLIFGGGLASGEIEPSEKFWNKAYEDILQEKTKPIQTVFQNGKGLSLEWEPSHYSSVPMPSICTPK